MNQIEEKIIHEARSRANPIETVKSGFFNNRSAMKIANLDKILGWALSREYDSEKRAKNNPLNEELQNDDGNK